MIKTLAITRKTLRELIREPVLLALMLAFPLGLLAIYALAFGNNRDGISQMSIFVVNNDTCATLEQAGTWCAGQKLITALEELDYASQPVFAVQTIEDPAIARPALRERKAAVMVTIPIDFSQQLVNGKADPAILHLTGDLYSDGYIIAYNTINLLLREFAAQTAPPHQTAFVNLDYRSIAADQSLSDFDFGVGGIIVFGIMFITISSAQVLVREKVSGTLRRLQLSTIQATQSLGGVLLAQMLLAMLMVPLVFGTALLFGFEASGSLLFALVVSLLLSLCATGLGLLVACFAHSDGEAVNLATGLLAPLVFLSGSLYPMPEAKLFNINNQTIQVYDIFPTTHAADALRRILTYGDAPADIVYELVMLVVLSGLFFAVGTFLYRHLQLRQT